MKIRKRPGPGLIAGAAGIWTLGVILGIQAAGAATCMDELDRFERRLQDSSLAEKDPDTFQALVREAEQAAGLRDEEQCLQKVAELNSELPEDARPQPVSRTPSAREISKRDNPSRPAAPVLMLTVGDQPDDDQATAMDETQDGGKPVDDPTGD